VSGVLSSTLFFNKQTLLHLLLALDAVRRPGYRIQPLGLNIFTAVYALAIRALGDPIQRFFDQPERIPLISALREQ
jgi:hypothetical protein